MSEMTSSPAELDPITVAVLSKRFDSVTTKMANTLLRTARSGVLNQARDFSTSIVTRNGELLTGAEALPIHTLCGADLMAQAMTAIHPKLLKGDAFLHNSPYHGCSHAADHTILVPVIDDEGVHHFTIWVKGHQADCGNSLPTTYMSHARDVYEEGALIFPAVRVQEGYRDIQDVIRMCEMRIRVPGQWRGDYLASVGAARIGEREILSMAEEYGWDILHEFSRQWLDYSERTMVAAIRRAPSGAAYATSTHDQVPGAPKDGITIKAKVTIDSENDMVDIDLRENPDIMTCGLNLSEACARTAAMMGVFYSLEDTVPTNAGSFRRIRVHLREGCIVGGGKHPTSMSVATTNLADRVTCPVMRAFAKIKDGMGLAEAGAFFPASLGVISGVDQRRRDTPFMNQVFLLSTAGPASPRADGWLNFVHAGNAGMCLLDSVELDELHFPIVVRSRRIVPDSEGAGRTTGAPAGYCEYGPVPGSSLSVSYIADGSLNSAKGARGGHQGARSRNQLRRVGGDIMDLPNCENLTLNAGETIISYTPGGGGYGLPLERLPSKVREDVLERRISRQRAEEVYGVVIAVGGEIDHAATDQLRNRRASRSSAQ
jgi:N-methylhydantoinase B